MKKAVRDIRGVRRAPGVDRVYLPGEREALSRIELQRYGIALGTGVLKELNEMGARYGEHLAVRAET